MNAQITPSNALKALEVQGLTIADVDANREGRVGPGQLKRVGAVASGGKAAVYMFTLPLSLGTLGFAVWHYAQNHQSPIFVLLAVAITFCAIIYFGVYRMFRLPGAAEIANATVIHLPAKVTASMIASNRGVYNVWLDGVRYSGCASSLTDDVRMKGSAVNAYVIREHKLCLALVPAA